jgi:hypothetical protein
MDVWMEKQVLAPTVQDGEEPNLCAEVLGIARYFQQRFCDRTKQQVVEYCRIALTQPVQLVGQSEHHMKVRQSEQLLFPASEPSLACLRLALGAVPVPARVEGDGRMTAPGTVIEMTA